MEIIRKTNVLIKTARRIIVHHSSFEEQINCEQCDGFMITAQQHAQLNSISVRAVFRLIEESKIRFIETELRVVFVCPNCTPAI